MTGRRAGDDAATASDVDPVLAGADYAVAIVTAVHPGTGERSGCLVGFFTQCSIDPLRFLICISVENHTYRVARHAHGLAVHLLEPHQLELATLFGTTTGDEVDKFAACEWWPGPAGLPLLTACPRWLAGRVLQRTTLGDHVGFLLAPTHAGAGSGAPVLMYSAVRDLQAGHRP